MASIFEDHWEKTYTDNKDIIDMYRPNAPQKFKMLLIVIIKIWVVPFMNVLTAMTSSLLDTLVNLDFALHVAINIKTIEWSLYYKLHTTTITDKLFLLFLNNLENIFSFPLKNVLIFYLKLLKKLSTLF